MTLPSDVALSQVECVEFHHGLPESADCFFSPWEPNFVVHMAKDSSLGCAGGSLHCTGSHRLRPIGKARHRVSLRRSCLILRCVPRSGWNFFSIRRRAGLGIRAGIPPGHSPAGVHPCPCFYVVHPCPCLRGTIFMWTQSKPSRSSGLPAWVKR
jgi:hypothetical protein